MTLTRYLALPDVWSLKGGRDTGSGPLLILGNRRLESCSNRGYRSQEVVDRRGFCQTDLEPVRLLVDRVI